MSDRDQGGKFQPGNQAAKGARHGKAHELRRWFRDAVTKEDVEAVAQALVAKALEHGGHDNVTVAVTRYSMPGD